MQFIDPYREKQWDDKMKRVKDTYVRNCAVYWADMMERAMGRGETLVECMCYTLVTMYSIYPLRERQIDGLILLLKHYWTWGDMLEQKMKELNDAI